jgi:predicted small lipoprotein YifL
MIVPRYFDTALLMKISPLKQIFFMIFVSQFCLVGCGQKKPLFMPEVEQSNQQQQPTDITTSTTPQKGN